MLRPRVGDATISTMPRANLDKQPHEVAAMFDEVAPRYDHTNSVLSLRQDRRWREQVRRALDVRPGERVLDLAAGTGTSYYAMMPDPLAPNWIVEEARAADDRYILALRMKASACLTWHRKDARDPQIRAGYSFRERLPGRSVGMPVGERDDSVALQHPGDLHESLGLTLIVTEHSVKLKVPLGALHIASIH